VQIQILSETVYADFDEAMRDCRLCRAWMPEKHWYICNSGGVWRVVPMDRIAATTPVRIKYLKI
jgi:hypothetical protein